MCGKCMCQQPTTKTFFCFAERKEKRFVDVVNEETQSIGTIKAQIAVSVKMSEKNENGENKKTFHQIHPLLAFFNK